MITLQNVTLRRGTKVLLETINLTLYAKQKIGLIGDNGCGKSTFFSLLQGEFEAYQGSVSMPSQLQVAHVAQEIPTSTQPATDYIIDGDKRYRFLERALKEAEEEGQAHLLATLHDELATINGYAIMGKAEKILKGLGFQSNQLQNPTNSFSGGWRMRLNLAQALMSRSELLLLDEPTNHLDLDAIIWLERWLQEYSGTLLVISHDREFLDNTVNHILHFEDMKLKLYRGNYSSFEKQHAQQLAINQANYDKQQAKITHMQAFVARFRAKASKAKQAQSRLKALEKMEILTATQTPDTFRFSFKQPQSCPNPLLKIEDAAIGYDPHAPLLTDVNLQIAPSDRFALLGVNGAGKTTLIKVLANLLQPFSGLVHFYKGIKIGYFAQHQIEHLDFTSSPLKLLQEVAPKQNEQVLRQFLGRFNFSGEMAMSPITHFSGGEKARLALALIVWQAPNLLLLDEPTNHLDMKMREALILALQDYNGALVLVSHDRYLIRTTTDALKVVANKKVEAFQGDLDDYRQWLFSRNTSIRDSKAEKPLTLNLGKTKRKLETKLKSLEKKMQHLQQENEKIAVLLADNDLYEAQQHDKVKAYQDKQQEVMQQIATLEVEWLALLEEIDLL